MQKKEKNTRKGFTLVELREKYPQRIYTGGIDRCAGHSGDPCGIYDTGADIVYREKSGGIRPHRGAGGVY